MNSHSRDTLAQRKAEIDGLREKLAPVQLEYGGTPNRFGMLMTRAAFTGGQDWSEAVRAYLSSDTWANNRVSLGGVISANTGVDPENASSELLVQSIEILQDPETTFRFDGSDLMPGAVGADSFWKGIVSGPVAHSWRSASCLR